MENIKKCCRASSTHPNEMCSNNSPIDHIWRQKYFDLLGELVENNRRWQKLLDNVTDAFGQRTKDHLNELEGDLLNHYKEAHNAVQEANSRSEELAKEVEKQKEFNRSNYEEAFCEILQLRTENEKLKIEIEKLNNELATCCTYPPA